MPLDPVTFGVSLISGGSSLFGLLGSAAEKRRAEAAQQAALADIERQIKVDEYQRQMQNRTSLAAATGQGGDALQSLGRNLGSATAAAGVYNSSATAGALAQGQTAIGQQLAGLARQQNYDEQSLHGQNLRYLAGLRYNAAGSQLEQANAGLATARGGLQSFLGSLAQFNLRNSGQSQVQNALPRSSGGYGNPGVLEPGGTDLMPHLQGALGGGGQSLNPYPNFNPTLSLPPRPMPLPIVQPKSY